MESTALLSAYTSIAAAVMVSRSMVEQVNPKPILGSIRSYFNPKQTMKFEEFNEVGDRNQLYDYVEHYLRDKIDAHTERIRATKTSKKKIIGFALDDDQEVVDRFDNFFVQWRYVVVEAKEKEDRVKRYYELIYPKKHHERVKKSYLEQVKAVAKDVENKEKVLKIYTIRSDVEFRKYRFWESTILEHSSTFDTLAMEPAEKKRIRDDLELFTKRKEFYKNAGKAWKRGYLLYGPPGTGKSSLIAAMANYLQYKVYDLELTSIANNSELRKALLSTKNRSIVVIEDIDCSLEIQNRDKENDEESDSDDEYPKKKKKSDKEKVTLSGLLNFVDGLWSSCGEQRIFVFTTNYKDKLDPALLRPGRMDVHIHMSYCTPCAFRILAQNYLQIGESNPHHLFSEIEDLIQSMEVTPAQVAGELQLSPDADVSLSGLVHFLKNLKEENEKKKKEKEEEEKKKKEAEAEHRKLMKKMLKFCWKKREIT